ncbi:hypothetical protein C7A10_02720 [Pseudomonas fluorescens]|uniref:Uncharacterized protein n=1 Tax=Pseudomonas fluorescens TaxID=294 RepID=A0A2T0IGU9_PSEFL|nr:hypothetical protein C7A10_02720 [Pseudomonas fluorescens]
MGAVWHGFDVTRCIFLENFIALMVTIDANDGPAGGTTTAAVMAFAAVRWGAGQTPVLQRLRRG